MRASRFSTELFQLIAATLLVPISAPATDLRPECADITNQPPAIQLRHLLAHSPDSELEQIGHEAGELARHADAAAKARKASRRQRTSELPELSPSELRSHFQEPKDQLSSREIRALEEISRRIQSLPTLSPAEHERALNDLLELLAGLRNLQRSPVPTRVGALTPWRLLVQNRDRSIGFGRAPATNLECTNASDLSRCDPLPSGFWMRPRSIASQDLRCGFGRTELPSFTNPVWDYAGPKTSAGTQAGFEVRSGRLRLKVKLAEVSSEPFTARIFHALGYHVDPTDYASEMRIRYSRRLIREFNLRRPLEMKLRPFWIPVGTLEMQPYRDPFIYIRTAVFKDGTTVGGNELKQLLFVDAGTNRPEDNPSNFRTDVEDRLDFLIFGPANLQSDDAVGETVGSWDFEGLGHENRRELRGAGLLAAWLGWFDSRFDNTRIRSVHNGNRSELLFFFTDLGAGMGSGHGWLTRHGEDLESMEDRFTSAPVVRGPGRMTTPFRVRHYETIVPTRAFQEMTVDDARWMARMIAQLSEEQLRDALNVSGYSEAEVERYLAKLLNRRSRMLEDLGIADEFRTASR